MVKLLNADQRGDICLITYVPRERKRIIHQKGLFNQYRIVYILESFKVCWYSMRRIRDS